jgi:hypothetical protein
MEGEAWTSNQAIRHLVCGPTVKTLEFATLDEYAFVTINGADSPFAGPYLFRRKHFLGTCAGTGEGAGATLVGAAQALIAAEACCGSGLVVDAWQPNSETVTRTSIDAVVRMIHVEILLIFFHHRQALSGRIGRIGRANNFTHLCMARSCSYAAVRLRLTAPRRSMD